MLRWNGWVAVIVTAADTNHKVTLQRTGYRQLKGLN